PRARRKRSAGAGGRASMALPMAGALMPAATAEAFLTPGSTTAVRRPRRLNPAAVHRPSTPAPITATSKGGSGELERGTGCPSTSRAPIQPLMPDLISPQPGPARLFQTVGPSSVLAPQGLGQADNELLVEGGDPGSFPRPDVGV